MRLFSEMLNNLTVSDPTAPHPTARAKILQNHLALAAGILLILPSAAAMAAGPFDGTYIGTQRETGNNNSSCCTNRNRDDAKIRVSDSKFIYKWASRSKLLWMPRGRWMGRVRACRAPGRHPIWRFSRDGAPAGRWGPMSAPATAGSTYR